MSTPTHTQRAETSMHTEHTFVDRIVKAFLHSNLSLILLVVAVAAGTTALLVTPREEDPQIVVPLADVLVQFPGRSAGEVEQLVATPLERILYQIDGVEYVYSMSRRDEAVITVRFFVGEDRERSLVKLFKKIDEHIDIVPPGVTGWVIKPVEIDDVPIVTLTLTASGEESAGDAADEFALRRVAEELRERLAAVPDVSRVNVIGGRPRVVYVYLSADRMRAYQVSPSEIERAIRASNVTVSAGDFPRDDAMHRVEIHGAVDSVHTLQSLVIGVFGDRPVFLKDVAEVVDGPEEPARYVRHGWGPAREWVHHHHFPGTRLGAAGHDPVRTVGGSTPAVTLAIAKKRGSNAVRVAENALAAAERLKHEIVPAGVEMVITRNAGLTADEKVNELVEALGVAILIILLLLTLSMGWREASIVAITVPIVFGLTLIVNYLAGYTINRVTLFALILSLGLLVDDPIVDVENIARHFGLRGRATREIVREAVAEVRPPLITATLAVIVSFLPMFFITGMMGPYMAPMALNVPVVMLMSMLVSFTITPWLTYHVLRRQYGGASAVRSGGPVGGAGHAGTTEEEHDLEVLRRSVLWRVFYPLMAPLLRSRWTAWVFLLVIGGLTVAAAGLAALRVVPLKMLPFDNKNELLLVLDLPEGTTLERSDAAVREFERYLAGTAEVVDYTSYVGVASPMDFNGLVRHYYLRGGSNVAEIRVNLVHKKNRRLQSHGLGLRMRDDLAAIAQAHAARLKIVELPPGPPVISTLVAEIYGRPDDTYEDLLAAADTVRARLEREPGVVDVDDVREAPQRKLVFTPDQEKAAISGISVSDLARALEIALGGAAVGTVQAERERNPLQIVLRAPLAERASAASLAQLHVKGQDGQLVPLAELGRWSDDRVDQTIYHKNLQRVAYVFAETAGRAPPDAAVDIIADQADAAGVSTSWIYRGQSAVGAERRQFVGRGWVEDAPVRPVERRTFVYNGGGVRWHVPEGIQVDFAGEGEWKITLDVFRDLGLAFAAAMVGIYILLVAQTRSFTIPVVVMLAIPLTILGVMPGFWLLNALSAQVVSGYPDPVFFTATGMIGMIALAGIVTRDAIILVDFIHLSLRRGRSLFDAILESRVVRLRPILLTTATAMLGAAPIVIDPIFSGLAWALIFGLLASTLFTLFVIPVAYWLLYANKPGHGLPQEAES